MKATVAVRLQELIARSNVFRLIIRKFLNDVARLSVFCGWCKAVHNLLRLLHIWMLTNYCCGISKWVPNDSMILSLAKQKL